MKPLTTISYPEPRSVGMKLKALQRHVVTLECEGDVWTLWYGKKPLLRTVDGQGARQLANRLQCYLDCIPHGHS